MAIMDSSKKQLLDSVGYRFPKYAVRIDDACDYRGVMVIFHRIGWEFRIPAADIEIGYFKERDLDREYEKYYMNMMRQYDHTRGIPNYDPRTLQYMCPSPNLVEPSKPKGPKKLPKKSKLLLLTN